MPEYRVEPHGDAPPFEPRTVQLTAVPKQGSWFDMGDGTLAQVKRVKLIDGEAVIFARTTAAETHLRHGWRDNLTLFLALWGAVVATALGLVQGWDRWIDRPRISIEAQASWFNNGCIAFGFDVSNVGRRATSIRETGFLIQRERFPGERPPPGVPEPWEAGSRPGTIRVAMPLSEFRYGATDARASAPLLNPGEIVHFRVAVDRRFRSLFTRKSGRYDLDSPLVPYVVDSDDHTVKAKREDAFSARQLIEQWETRGAPSPVKTRCPASKGYALVLRPTRHG